MIHRILFVTMIDRLPEGVARALWFAPILVVLVVLVAASRS